MMTEEELTKARVQLEWAMSAALKRLLTANDAYGNSILRHALMDEMNDLMRMQNKCLSPVSQKELNANTRTLMAHVSLPS